MVETVLWSGCGGDGAVLPSGTSAVVSLLWSLCCSAEVVVPVLWSP